MKAIQIRHNVLILSDGYSGTLFWRFQQFIDELKFMRSDIVFTNLTSLNMPYDVLYYSRFDIIICHLTLGKPVDFLFKAKRDGILKAKVFWSQDDLTVPDQIADYIKPKELFVQPQVQDVIRQGIEASDYVITTTPFLRDRISTHYGKPVGRILLWPNLVSYRWFGGRFVPDIRKQEFRKHKNSRICALFSGALNHISDDCKVTDDISVVEDTVRKLGDGIQFKIMSAPNSRISQFNGKLVPVGSSDIIHFPQFYYSQHADAMIAPLMDSEFNRCKSNIKVLEAAMMGVVPFVQRLEPYVDWLPDSLLFSDADELSDKLKDFTTWSADRFGNTIMENYRRFTNATDYYGRPISSFFADNNYDNFISLMETSEKNEGGKSSS